MYALFPVVNVSLLNFQAVQIFGDTIEGAQGILHGCYIHTCPYPLSLIFIYKLLICIYFFPVREFGLAQVPTATTRAGPGLVGIYGYK